MAIPSDLKVLSTIYKMYQKDFLSWKTGGENSRETKVWVPIDCRAIAQTLKVDPDIIFGRLYFHMQEKYSYTRRDGSNVGFYELQVGREKKAINFPLMTSVLAGMQEENRKHNWTLWLSTIAIVISVAGVVAQLAG